MSAGAYRLAVGRVGQGVDWGWFPDPWRFVRCAWEPDARRLLIFEEHSANKMMPADTRKIVVDSLTYPDESGGDPYYHDQIVYCDDTPDSKVQTPSFTCLRRSCKPAPRTRGDDPLVRRFAQHVGRCSPHARG